MAEQGPVRSLWDRQGSGKTFRPVEEDSLSDDVNLFLRRELISKLGSSANRRRSKLAEYPGAPVGKRPGLRIDAIKRLE